MKLSLLLFLTLSSHLLAQQIGDSPEKVEAVLGKPTTAISRNGQDIKIYKNGAKVFFEKGTVVKIDGVKNRVLEKGSGGAADKNVSTRLLGTWMSDYEKTLEYFKYLGRGKTTEPAEEILKKYVGKTEVSFSQDKVSMKAGGAVKEFNYEVVGEYNSVVRIRVFHKEETIDFTQEFHFESEGVYWTPHPTNPLIREYFTKK
ncbi:MAG: hypothetical protein QM760_19610 [Nibricoccus sp.]